MPRTIPLLASEETAAKLLDMKPAEFRALVQTGHLPRGREIVPGLVRWDSETLRQIGRGDSIEGEIEW